MYIEIVSPDRQVFSGEIKMVQVPGTKGSFEIFSNHAPIISTLNSGKITLRESSGAEKTFEIKSGVIEAANNNIVVLAEE